MNFNSRSAARDFFQNASEKMQTVMEELGYNHYDES